MKTLLFLTSSYPYYPAEFFIENEIPYLAEAFDTVCVVPMGGDDTRPPRAVPENVIVADDVRRLLNGGRRGLLEKIAIGAVSLPRGIHAVGEEALSRRKAIMRKSRALPAMLRQAAVAGYIAPAIEELIVRHKPSVVYSYWLSTSALAAQLALDRLGRPAPLAARSHRFDLYEEENDLNYCPFQNYLVSRLDAVLPVSDHGTSYIKGKYGGIARGDIRTSLLGVHGGGISRPSADGVARVASCSFARPIKRLPLMAEAIGQLDYPVLWTHIGDGPQLPEVRRLAADIMKEKPHIRIEFKGELPNREVLNYYDTNPVDVFLNASSSEGIPVSIMEASSRGIPTVATDVGGTSELVHDGDGGGLLMPRDVTSAGIAESLSLMLNEPKKDRKNRREAAYRRWNKCFNAATNYGEFCGYLQSL
ncbi:MAG: glycosyltransferase [Synergistaceae bacterium]|nr:glycosyltransferase [Synergistota bacterium]NLM72372.1 glycosyltransferase [Synergistaceae bacterium]